MSSVQSLLASLSKPADLTQERPLDAVPTRSFDCSHLLSMCEKEEPDNAEQPAGDGVPTAVIDEQTTQPYGDEQLARMMDTAVNMGQSQPPRVAKEEKHNRGSLPGVRCMHASLFETALVFFGAVILPIVTIGSLRAVTQWQKNRPALSAPKTTLQGRASPRSP